MLTTRRYEYLPINHISIHPTIANHRQLSLNKVTHLEKDILKNGLLEPLVVWERQAGEYFLVGGFHRMEAIKRIRIANPTYFDRVDVRVIAGDPDEIKALNLKLNADRLDIKITDYFETVIYLNNVNWSAERIAEFLDKSVSWIEEIIHFAPMVNDLIRQKLESGELSWNRAKQIIQKSLKAPAGEEKAVIEEELAKQQGRVSKPLSFKSVLGHLANLRKTAPDMTYSIKLDHLYSLFKVLQGKEYSDQDIELVNEVFPELISLSKERVTLLQE
jgi:ParB-like chromosome segregation protein Spo0J